MKKNIKKVLSLLTTIVVIICVLYVIRINNYIDLTQFGATTSRQMMAYGIKTKNNQIVLIDGGTQGDAEQIYMSINSKEWHLENDSSRVEDIENFFEVMENEELQQKVIEPQIGDEIKIDNITAEILGIKNPEITTNATNNSSMVIKIKVNHKKILFLGDTGAESSEKLIREQGNNLKADIVQVAHHGQDGATEELYNIVKPEICLWPTPDWLWRNDINGTEDSGPWKTKETRKWMDKLKVKQHYIEKDGTHEMKIF